MLPKISDVIGLMEIYLNSYKFSYFCAVRSVTNALEMSLSSDYGHSSHFFQGGTVPLNAWRYNSNS